MSRDQLTQKLIEMLLDIAPSVEMSAAKANQKLEDVGYDSLDQSSFLLSIDEQLGVKIENEHVQGLRTLNDYVDHLSARL